MVLVGLSSVFLGQLGWYGCMVLSQRTFVIRLGSGFGELLILNGPGLKAHWVIYSGPDISILTAN